MEKIEYKDKLYRVYLVEEEPDCFGNNVSSDNWKALLDIIDDDLNKRKVFEFIHPKDSHKHYYRRYRIVPAKGVLQMVLGQFRDPLDFAYVRFLLYSYKYKVPYIVVERYNSQFLNPDHMAKMVENAINKSLKGSGVKVLFKPWVTNGMVILYSQDFDLSYEHELRAIKGACLIQAGFEDSLEDNKKKEEKKRRRKEAHAKTEHNKFDILNYMSSKVKNKPKLLDWLDEKVIGQNLPRGMMRPVRFLINKKLMKGLTISAFNKRYHKEGLISVSSFNNYTNKQYVCFVDDPIYDDMEENFEIDRFI